MYEKLFISLLIYEIYFLIKFGKHCLQANNKKFFFAE
jgi:hypothetical protein